MTLAWIRTLLQIAAQLLREIAVLLAAILLAVVVFVLAVVRVCLLGVRWLVPALLRIACIAAWVVSVYAAFLGTQELYGKFSDPVPMAAIGMAAGIVLVAIPVVLIEWLLKQATNLLLPWGAFVFAALVGAAIWGIAHVATGQPDTYVVAGVSPTILAAAGMIYLAVKLKKGRRDVEESNG